MYTHILICHPSILLSLSLSIPLSPPPFPSVSLSASICGLRTVPICRLSVETKAIYTSYQIYIFLFICYCMLISSPLAIFFLPLWLLSSFPPFPSLLSPFPPFTVLSVPIVSTLPLTFDNCKYIFC